ncbi:EthD domain-containing protein [Streptomyces olindensis]|uniref:EthD domain-containing protein n=1 Tax=Streptomyces olindensis TaxID=358823 RepID=A0ABV2XNQ2_9ACTN
MLTLIAAVRRKPGMTHQAFVHYLHHVHGPLAAAKPLGVRRYVQNHVFDASFGSEGDAAHLTVFGRDAVTELQFHDKDALAATMSDPYTREVIGPDGAHFNDMPSALALLARPVAVTPPPRRYARTSNTCRYREPSRPCATSAVRISMGTRRSPPCTTTSRTRP